jgi:hypothetical protein
VKVTYLAGEQSGQRLQELFAVTHLDQFINVVIVNDARP